ncbi:MAG: tetratricopeptide repeat protein [Candidatus Gastranaerophilaceae bacterium]|nr:tetratricopeptide repeat protein [Candidatus Gastranaerophilaceae bacterium]
MFATKIRIFIVIFLLLLWLIPYAMQHSLSQSDKEYMEHFDKGYSCYQNGDYRCSLSEYNSALKIYNMDKELYIRIATAYEKLEMYSNAIEYAKKALKYPDSKSIYKRANGFMFPLHTDVSAYYTIGTSSLQLEKYTDALNAFNYVLKHTSFKYTDAHFYLGQAYFGLGETKKALEEFMEHKATVEAYISEDIGSYYTLDDIDTVNQWIDMAAAVK